MSAIAGVFQFDGDAVPSRLLQAMTDSVRHRGPDAGDCWIAGRIGLGHRSMWSTPEAVRERQPLRDALRDLCLVLDGRVDNREELARSLRAGGCTPHTDSDAELVLLAYDLWGEDAPRRIVGDFAFALWDGRRQRLFCARDIAGVRPFHYCAAARRLLFGSELQQMLRDPLVPARINEGMFGEYLAFAITSFQDTLFKDVRRLPPAHWMSVAPDGSIRVQRYWQIEQGASIRHARDEDYAEQLLELLERSIDCRLRARGPVGANLSGGLDSSAVSVIAHRRLAAQGVAGADYTSAGVTYAGLPCDESGHMLAVAQHAGMPLELLPFREVHEHEFADLARRHHDFPGYPMSNSLLGTFCAAARRRGGRVILSGMGSDEIFSGNADQVAASLGRLRLMRAWDEAGGVASGSGISRTRALLRHGLKPWLRRAAGIAGLTGLRKPRLPWLSPEWSARIDLGARIAPAAAMPGGAVSAHECHFYEMADLFCFGAGIEWRHPMFDRRLIEFAHAVPADLHRRGGRRKSLLRLAMRGILPDKTLQPGTNVDFTMVNVRAIDRILRRGALSGWPAARAGWIDARALESSYRAARGGLLGGGAWSGLAIWHTWMAYAAGLVLEAAPGGATAVQSELQPSRTIEATAGAGT